MKIIKPSITPLEDIDGEAVLRRIERAGRVCYKSEERMTGDSARKFIANIIGNGHESVLEHEKVSLLLICDRGVTHEIVRHRIASYSQESTRYCNYGGDKFGSEITVIEPLFFEQDSDLYRIWRESCEAAERAYFALLEAGAKPEEARSVLPNSLKTEIAVTMNLREWRHFLKLRTSPRSHPQMREVARLVETYLQDNIPIVFDTI
jgi:thymidylate synthase (FAD)